MRCPDCNKFVGFDEGNVDEITAVIDDNGVICVSGRVVLPCADCGTELKELHVEEEYDVNDDFAEDALTVIRNKVPEKHHPLLTDEWFRTKVSVEYIMDDPDVVFSERTQTHTTRKTKKGIVQVPIKNSRYAKSYKGVCVEGDVTRKIVFPEFNDDGSESHEHVEIEETTNFKVEVEEQSSNFDELV